MTVTYVGELSLSEAIPGAALCASSGLSGIAAGLGDLTGRIAALQAFSPSPVNFTAQLAIANSIVESVTQAIVLGLPVPSIAAQIAAIGAMVASLLAQLSAVSASLSIVEDFQSLMTAAGVHVFAFAGTASDFGGELGAAVASSPLVGASSAVVLATNVGLTWVAMQSIFRVTP